MSDFVPFPKMARLSREVVVTEKIDGTNAQIFIDDDGTMLVGSRSRWITPQVDNYGFAGWVERNRVELAELGPGRHFGEWWGNGIQRRYNVPDKRFSLFNAVRWGEDRPACCGVVPVLYSGGFSLEAIEVALGDLAANGSRAAPGFMEPEGVVVFHTAALVGFKKTIERDEVPKGLTERAVAA